MEIWRAIEEGFGTARTSLRIPDLRLCFLTIVLAYGIYRYVTRLIAFQV